jgi:uncharacterized oligopeptide transporter (OPT) family protein
LTSAFLNVTNNVISFVNETFYKWRFQLEVNPMLLGIGFIVGLPVALTMFSSSILANFVIPADRLFCLSWPERPGRVE